MADARLAEGQVFWFLFRGFRGFFLFGARAFFVWLDLGVWFWAGGIVVMGLVSVDDWVVIYSSEKGICS